MNKELSHASGFWQRHHYGGGREIQLRKLLVRQLRSGGYSVLEAGYALEALEVAVLRKPFEGGKMLAVIQLMLNAPALESEVP